MLAVALGLRGLRPGVSLTWLACTEVRPRTEVEVAFFVDAALVEAALVEAALVEAAFLVAVGLETFLVALAFLTEVVLGLRGSRSSARRTAGFAPFRSRTSRRKREPPGAALGAQVQSALCGMVSESGMQRRCLDEPGRAVVGVSITIRGGTSGLVRRVADMGRVILDERRAGRASVVVPAAQRRHVRKTALDWDRKDRLTKRSSRRSRRRCRHCRRSGPGRTRSRRRRQYLEGRGRSRSCRAGSRRRCRSRPRCR